MTLVVLAGVTACSGAGNADTIDQPGTTTSTTTAGRASEPLTQDEYRTAFDAFRECVRKGGVDLIISGEEHEVIQYAFQAEDREVVDKCYSAGFGAVDMQWQQQQLPAG